MLPPAVASDVTRRRRFARESQALAALNHSNIVTIHSVDEVEDQPFLVMEWTQGLPLGDLIPAGGLPSERFLGLAVPLAAAVAQAHQEGIVHRDLKPGNVMVRDDGVLKVVDFGISLMAEPETLADGQQPPVLLAETLTAVGTVLGTLPYMARCRRRCHGKREKNLPRPPPRPAFAASAAAVFTTSASLVAL